jgi:hypothetical protein
METPWEPLSTRAKVEEFLSLLTNVPHLALLVSSLFFDSDGTQKFHQITMQGAEHPGKVTYRHFYFTLLGRLARYNVSFPQTAAQLTLYIKGI